MAPSFQKYGSEGMWVWGQEMPLCPGGSGTIKRKLLMGWFILKGFVLNVPNPHLFHRKTRKVKLDLYIYIVIFLTFIFPTDMKSPSRKFSTLQWSQFTLKIMFGGGGRNSSLLCLLSSLVFLPLFSQCFNLQHDFYHNILYPNNLVSFSGGEELKQL